MRRTAFSYLALLLAAAREPVPDNGACDLNLPDATCSDCALYYDPRPGYGNTDNGKCVWVPEKGLCFPNSWASRQGWTVIELTSECPAETPAPVGQVSACAEAYRCGPAWNGCKCAEIVSPYCNEASGWCGNSDAHQNAQESTEYDYKTMFSFEVTDSAFLTDNGYILTDRVDWGTWYDAINAVGMPVMDGWTLNGKLSIIKSGSPAWASPSAAEGEWLLGLHHIEGATVSRDMSGLKKGSKYMLSWQYRHRQDYPARTLNVFVATDGMQATLGGLSTSLSWTQESMVFTAKSDVVSIIFKDAGGNDGTTFLDDVRFVEVGDDVEVDDLEWTIAANLANGSFELQSGAPANMDWFDVSNSNYLYNWSTAGVVQLIPGNSAPWSAPGAIDGSYLLVLHDSGASTATTTLTSLGIGNEYSLSWWYRKRYGYGPKTLSVTVGGELLFDEPVESDDWAQRSVTFVAAATSASLEFHDAGNNGSGSVFLDALTIARLDCAGVANGLAKVDRCGVCDGNDDCVDCNDVVDGGAVVDECGVCGGDGSSCADTGNAWKCYKYTAEEDDQITNEAENKQMCESHDGFIFTRGVDSKAPGCGSCWCCQPDGDTQDDDTQDVVRGPVPDNGACDWGLPDATCADCALYYDPRPGYGDTDNGKCVWVPEKGECSPKSWASRQGWTFNEVASDCAETGPVGPFERLGDNVCKGNGQSDLRKKKFEGMDAAGCRQACLDNVVEDKNKKRTCWGYKAFPSGRCYYYMDPVTEVKGGVLSTAEEFHCHRKKDCAGVFGGDAVEDICGVCDGDGSSCTDQCGVLDGDNACLDCNGVPHGVARMDPCGVCGGDGSTCDDMFMTWEHMEAFCNFSAGNCKKCKGRDAKTSHGYSYCKISHKKTRKCNTWKKEGETFCNRVNNCKMKIRTKKSGKTKMSCGGKAILSS